MVSSGEISLASLCEVQKLIPLVHVLVRST